MLDDDGNPLLEEPETPTEKLRRLRYEAEELEAQIEAEAAEKERSRLASRENGEESTSEYEQIDDLPRRDDADKTKPPPSRRRRKKAQSDANGELSPALLLKQLKRLRNDLSRVAMSDSDTQEVDGLEGSANGTRTQELLQKLGEIKASSLGEEPALTNGLKQPSTPSATRTNVSELDTRLELLEKHVGTNEGDIDEVCHEVYRISPDWVLNLYTLLPVSPATSTIARQCRSPRTSTPSPHPAQTSRYYISTR